MDPKHEQRLRLVQGARILLVEDNEFNQLVAIKLLEQARFHVNVANNGQEALDRLATSSYDCVLMDVQMPVMDGFEATARIRQDPRFEKLPVLAMTANATVEDREKTAAAGMNDHISKPIDPMELFEALLNWIEAGERELPSLPESDGDEEGVLADPIRQIEGLDVEAAVARVGGSIKSYRRLLEKFVDNQADALFRITSALESGDRDQAARVAHTLKGLGGTIGAPSLQKVAAKLEAAAQQENGDVPALLIADTGRELDRILNSIRSALADSEAAPDVTSEALSMEELRPRLNRLMEMLGEYDAEAESLLNDIARRASGSTLKGVLQEARKRLGQYDFEGTAELLKKVIAELPGSA